MLDLFLSLGMRPFTIALALVFSLLVLELLMLLVGSSLLGAATDLPDSDFDIDAEVGFDADIDAADGAGSGELQAGMQPGLLSWLGIGRVPFMIWLAAVLTGFGLSGFVLQSLSNGLFGALMPASLAILLALAPALGFARLLSGVFAALIPGTETSAVSSRGFGSQHGVISQGTARRGAPAEAKIRDRHGNTHYLRVEPYEDGAELPEGTEIYLIRKRDGRLLAMELKLD